MVSKAELLKWINSLDEDAFIGIDDGGLYLEVVGAVDRTGYLEIGGMPDEDDEEESDD